MAWWSWFVNLLRTWFSIKSGTTMATESMDFGMATMAAMPTNSHSGGDEEMSTMAAMPTCPLSGAAMPAGSPSGGDKKASSSVSIFRVPNFLKLSKKGGAYVPKIVSLGPYYHKNAELQAMEDHKRNALRRMEIRFKKINDSNSKEHFFPRAKDEILKNKFEIRSSDEEVIRCEEEELAEYPDFLCCAKKVILNLDGEIRKSYEEEIRCEEEELASMLCMDGCFILEILRTLGGEGLPVEGYEPIFERNRIDYTGFDILNDILKLENQVPLIVLWKLLELNSNDVEGNLFKWLVKSPSPKFYPFEYKELQPDEQEASTRSARCFNQICKYKNLVISSVCCKKLQPDDQPASTRSARSFNQMSKRLQPDQVQKSPHLLGLLHSLIVSSPCDSNCQSKPKEVKAVKRIPRAGKLKNVGIKFKACDAGIRKIRFDWEKGTIFLPRIYVTDHTEVLFRNLIAFELCEASDEINYVTCYVSLMDELIDMEEDVGVLIESEILTNYLGSDAEVAKLFNALCKGVTMSRTDDFEELKVRVHQQYRSKFKVWSADFLKKYTSSPWTTLALVGAVLALLLSVVQTVFSIIAVYK